MTWLKENTCIILSSNYDHQKKIWKGVQVLALNIVLCSHSLGAKVKSCFFVVHNL